MPTIDVTPAQLAARIAADIKSIETKLNAAVYKAISATVPAMKERAPVATHGLKESIKREGDAVVADIPYSGFSETGRRPGKMPPYEPIFLWCLVKGFADPDKVAYAIQRGIGIKGTQPTFFARTTVSADVKPLLDAYLQDALNKSP